MVKVKILKVFEEGMEVGKIVNMSEKDAKEGQKLGYLELIESSSEEFLKEEIQFSNETAYKELMQYLKEKEIKCRKKAGKSGWLAKYLIFERKPGKKTQELLDKAEFQWTTETEIKKEKEIKQKKEQENTRHTRTDHITRILLNIVTTST